MKLILLTPDQCDSGILMATLMKLLSAPYYTIHCSTRLSHKVTMKKEKKQVGHRKGARHGTIDISEKCGTPVR